MPVYTCSNCHAQCFTADTSEVPYLICLKCGHNMMADGQNPVDPEGDAAYWRARAEKAEAEFSAIKNDPKYYYAGFPIPRAAIEVRNQEISQLRDQLCNVTSRAMRNVLDERAAQDAKWGEQNHDPVWYLAILVEEVGEMAQAALHTRFGGKHGGLSHLREEAVQVAAVALAIVECLDRGKWKWSK